MLYLLILLASLLLNFIAPWWAAAPAAFLLSVFMAKRGIHAFSSGFFATATAWLLLYLYYCIPNDFILARRMSGFFGLPDSSLLLITGSMLIAVIGGMGAMAGFHLRRAVAGIKG